MTDAQIMAALRAELPHLSQRGFPTVARNVATLCQRLETLTEAHRLLAEREQRLTDQLYNGQPPPEPAADSYLAKFPADQRDTADRAYLDGFHDGANSNAQLEEDSNG